MKRVCPDLECRARITGPKSRLIVRNGSYRRKSDGQRIRRWMCLACRKAFSSARSNPNYRQKKRHKNQLAMLLLSAEVSQRRAARILRVNRKTVVRKFRLGARQAQLRQEAFRAKLASSGHKLMSVQWDDMETSEHSKCKPLSIALAVEPKSRKVLGFQVSVMPAKGPLARIAWKKYGYRPDRRTQGWDRLLSDLKPLVHEEAAFLTDQNPHYPRFMKRHFPNAQHHTTQGRRGIVAGQGELKEGGFDPLFSLNHTAAMLRANMNRLIRRTWCTTKNVQGLVDHLWLYIDYHNRVLTPPITT